jgi:hypothetical protein
MYENIFREVDYLRVCAIIKKEENAKILANLVILKTKDQ